MKCSFCGEEVERGTGLLHVGNDGSTLYFCSSKCRKNMLELDRKPREIEWAR